MTAAHVLLPPLVAFTLLIGCSADPSSTAPPAATTGAVSTAFPTPRRISGEEARAFLASDTTAVLVDVRTAAEYASGHASGAILLPHDEVAARAASLLPNRNAPVVLYCRSGRRSGIAAADLAALGYTNVLDFGPLSDWPGPVTRGDSPR